MTPSKYVCPNDAEYPLLPKYDSSFDQSHLLFAPRDVTSTPSTNNLILFIVSYKISIWYKTPTSALKLVNGKDLKVVTQETIGTTNLVGLSVGEQLVFTTVAEPLTVNAVSIELDYTQLEFLQNGKVVQAAISEYDKINAIYLNHPTAKTFVGDKYDSDMDTE